MGIFSRHGKERGFTIVELAVVIAVIGILATIVMMTWPGYQQRTRDSQRKSDLSQVASALKAYALQNNNYIEGGSGCGAFGNGNGWLSAGPDNVAAYPKSIVACLKDAKVLTNDGNFTDPSGCTDSSGSGCSGVPIQAYMKVTCQKNGAKVTYVFAHIEGDPRRDSTIDALCDANTVSGFNSTTQKWGTMYGMNYYVTVN